MADNFYTQDTTVLTQPPAKRARLEGPSSGSFDMPGTPIDDTDDDLYETTPVKISTPGVKSGEEPTSVMNLPLSEPNGLPVIGIPGLGLLDGAGQHHSPPQTNGDPYDTNMRLKQKDNIVVHGENPISCYDETHGNAEVMVSEGILGNKESRGATLSTKNNFLLQNQDGALVAEASLNKKELESARDTNDYVGMLYEGVSKETSLLGNNKSVGGFIEAAKANRDDESAEWQLDSSDADSSSDTSSDDSSESSSDEEYPLLDPEEQARILMKADVDDEPSSGEGFMLKTKNESDEKYEKPTVTITPDMKVTELGNVETVVDNLILVKANVSGEYQVLESGSVLCLGDRTAVGTVSETLGRVHEPLYAVGFPDSSDIVSLGISKGTTIFYVDQYSTYVFTQPLKAIKGSDASNIHDEEVGRNELEFSDDEAEAEYKRNLKQSKRAKIDAHRGELQHGDYHDGGAKVQVISNENHYRNEGLNYSDDEDMGMYKPLARPEHFEDIVGAGAPIEDRSHVRRGDRGRVGRGRGDRGRGNRGRGAGRGGGGRGDRGNRSSRGPEKHGPHHEHTRHVTSTRLEKRSRSPRSPNHHRYSSTPYHLSSAPAPAPAPVSASAYSAPPSDQTRSLPFSNSQAYGWDTANLSILDASNPQYPQFSQGPASSDRNIPAGAFVNPSFFPQQVGRQSAQLSTFAMQPQWQAFQQQSSNMNWAAIAQFFQTPNQPTTTTGAVNDQPLDPQAAFRAAQQQLDLLRTLNRSSDSPR